MNSQLVEVPSSAPPSYAGFRSLPALLTLLFLLVIRGGAQGAVGEVTLEWDPNPEPEVSGYRLHIGPGAGTYNQTRDAGNQTNITVGELVAGETYYFVVTAYDAAGNESLPSNEVSFTAPWPETLLAKTVLDPVEQGPDSQEARCSPRPNPAGLEFVMELSAPTWTAITVFASTDLKTWEVLGTIPNPTGQVVVTDLISREFPARFYRIGRAASLPP